jgi:hypothetical protein
MSQAVSSKVPPCHCLWPEGSARLAAIVEHDDRRSQRVAVTLPGGSAKLELGHQSPECHPATLGIVVDHHWDDGPHTLVGIVADHHRDDGGANRALILRSDAGP